MHVDVIDKLEDFERVRGPWEHAYGRDPNANFFVSWDYLYSWLPVSPREWFVLAARATPADPPRAFLPMARDRGQWRGVTLERELHLGGKPFADLTGFVCDPEVEEAALDAFGACVRDELVWDRFVLAQVIDPRLERFLSAFPGPRFSLEHGPDLVSPCVELATSWDEQLLRTMSTKNRTSVRRAIRRTEAAPGYRISAAGSDDLDAHIDGMMTLWQARWGTLEPSALRQFREVFRRTHGRGALMLIMIWDESVPVAGVTCFLDRAKKRVSQFITSYDPQFSKRSPGRAVIAHAMQASIELGFESYDFLLGDEEWKYSFGGQDQRAESVTLVRRGWRPALLGALRRRRRRNAAGSP